MLSEKRKEIEKDKKKNTFAVKIGLWAWPIARTLK
jgi:hypothetical protein